MIVLNRCLQLTAREQTSDALRCDKSRIPTLNVGFQLRNEGFSPAKWIFCDLILFASALVERNGT